MCKKSKKWWLVGVLGLLLVAGVYFVFDPLLSVWFPKCPFLLATGLECPGCGSQRAIHALLHGDIWGAIQANALFVVAIPYVLGALWRPRSERGEKVRRFFYGATALWTVFGVILFYFLLRNV